MSDLISRKALNNALIELFQEVDDMYIAGRVIGLVDAQPTAYDPKKVAEQLEEEKGIAFVTLANTGNKELDFTYQNVVAYMDKAIEMVKKGGAV